MTLSEININEALLYHTNKLITESSYHTLRQALLERKALPSVLHSIDFLVHEHCTTDKDSLTRQLTQEAYDTQLNTDHKQYQTDEQERSQDYALIAEYNVQLPLLQARLRLLEIEYTQQQHRYNGVQSQVDDLHRQLRQLNSQISYLQSENQLSNSSYRYTRYHTVTHNLEIPYQTHHHSHTQDYRLRLAEQQRQQLVASIARAERQASQERSNISNLGQGKRRIEEECRMLNHALKVEFPQKEQQRGLREKQREERQIVRISKPGNLSQLSAINREALQKRIQNKSHDLDNLREQLKEAALLASYDTYLTQLECFLTAQPTALSLNISERESLKQINYLMVYYGQLEQQGHLINHSLDKERHKLSQLQLYVQENARLTQENAELAVKRDNQITNRNTALFIALFGSTKVLMYSGLISSMLFVNPLVLIVPASFALLVAVSATATLVYQYQKASSERHISMNQQKINDNESASLKEEGITSSPVPNLNQQIENVQQKITGLEAQQASHQQLMAQTYHQAQNIGIYYTNSNGFFTPPTSNVYYLAPTAPPEEEPGQQAHSYGPGRY